MIDEISKTPNMSNEAMRGYLSPFATEQCFTDNVLQNTRSQAQ
jgi:hypothetical protein